MPNVAYLFNTPFPTHDPDVLHASLGDPANDFLEVMGPGYRLPVPWLCCFRPDDLKPVTYPTEDFDGNKSTHTVHLPSTTVSQAILNLERALPLFEAIVGDAALAHRYWADAMAFLRSLPLPYLLLDHTEILDAWGHEDTPKEVAGAMRGDASALPFLKTLARYEQGVPPYPPDVLSSGGGPDELRNNNAVAMDVAGYAQWRRPADGTRPDFEVLDVRSESDRRDMRTVIDRVCNLLQVRDPGAYAFYGYMDFGTSRLARLARRLKIVRRERLKLLLQASTDARRAELLGDRGLRQVLEGSIAAQLRAICDEHGFEWRGFVIESRDSLSRLCKNANDWAALPAVPPLAS